MEVNSGEAQLQSSSQASLHWLNVVQRPRKERSSQGILYNEFIKEELKRLLGRSKSRADAAPNNDFLFHKIRHRNWLSAINASSGAWLTAGASPKIFEMSNDEFVSAMCRRNTVEDPTVPKYIPWLSREDPQLFQCTCDGGATPKPIDPFGYHFVGCKVGANAIRLHDEVVAVVARLFRSLRLDVIVEPTRLFDHNPDNPGDVSNQRPDIFIRNPRGASNLVIIDVAVTGIDGQSRTSDEVVERPLQVRYDQKMAKYGHLAQQRELRFIPAVFSHTGQIHEAFKVFVKEQIRLKFEAFEGEVKRSKVRSYMNWWIKCISAVIVKTASRNVAFKATRMRDSIMDGQDKFIMRESDNAEVGAREDCDEDLLDVGCNVDLYVANHESADLLHEEQVGDALSTSNESGQDYVQFRSLSLD